MSDSITVEEFERLRTSGTPIVVDIRRAVDFESDPQIIPGALRGDPDEIDDWAATLPRGTEVVVYCVRGGSVSQSVTPQLRERGVRARYLVGGIAAWKQRGGKTNPPS
jgi:rhodanese-related sulfurtransferase